MSRVFLSHSSLDSRQAIAVKRWLEQEAGLTDEIFLDLDPHTGIRSGQRWKQALQQANARCEAVICLLSAHWAASRECQTEYRYAETLNKAIVVARLEEVPECDITSEWQYCDLFGDGPTTEITVDEGEPVLLTTEGLHRLRNGLRALGIGAEHFPWPPPDDPGRAPYRGWAPLEEADAAVFFGRDAQILRGMDALRGMRGSGVQSMLVILGPSGCGKSSFLRAGLLPRVRRDDRQFLPLPIVRPERAVLTGELGLAYAVHGLRTDLGLPAPLLGEIKTACLAGDVERLRTWLAEARDAARVRLIDVPADQPAPTLMLPLDQGEELFTADAGPQSPQFLQVLAGLLRNDAGITPGLIVAVTIRADRYEPLQTAQQLAGIQSVVFDELKPMPPAGFKEVITGPARRATDAGHRLTIQPALVDRLLADSAEGADALPLLALTLARLYHDFGDDGDLTAAEYESMGGLDQVVQTEIDTLLAADPTARQAELELLHDAFIPWLATINPDNDQPMRRLARYTELPPTSHQLIEGFVQKRLLVKDSRDGRVIVEVALESLLRQWRELGAWLRAESQDLKDADTLERAAADWQASGRDQAWLLQGTRLTEAEALSAKPGFSRRLDPTRDFVHASRERENDRIHAEQQRQQSELQAAQQHAAALRKRSRIVLAVLVVTALVAVVAVVLGIRANTAQDQADTRAREATALRLTTEGESMLARLKGGGDLRALQQIIAAQHITPTADEGALFTAAIKLVQTVKMIQTPAEAYGVAFSPDGTRIASGSADHTVRLWDAQTGDPVGEPLTGHSDRVFGVAFSPDGTRIASGSVDRTVRLWDAQSGQPVGEPLTGHTEIVYGVAFSPDGSRIASGSDDFTVRLWDAQSGQPVGQPLRHTDRVFGVAFSPDGTRIASGGFDHTVRLWDARTGQPVGTPLTGHTGAVNPVAFSPDGTRIASGSDDFTVRLWDAQSGQPVGEPLTGHTDKVFGVAFSPDGTRIVSSGADHTVRLWDARTGQSIGQPLTGHTNWVSSVAFNSDGTRIASSGADHTVRLWDAHTGQPLTGHTAPVNSVALSSDGTQIVSGGADRTVRVWDAVTGEPVGEPLMGHTAPVNSVALSSDGNQIVSGGADRTVRVWDARTGEPVGEPLMGHTAPVNSVALSSDGSQIVSGGADHTVRVWDAVTGEPVGELLGHTAPVNSVALSSDGNQIASGGADHTVRVWNARTGEPIGEPFTGHTSWVNGVAFNPDGTRIVSGGADHVRLWDARTGQPVGLPLTGHTGPVNSVAFSADGTRIASGSADHTVRVWPGYADASALCAKLTTDMSDDQWGEWVSRDIEYVKVCP